jgi:hypothetical protein
VLLFLRRCGLRLLLVTETVSAWEFAKKVILRFLTPSLQLKDLNDVDPGVATCDFGLVRSWNQVRGEYEYQ